MYKGLCWSTLYSYLKAAGIVFHLQSLIWVAHIVRVRLCMPDPLVILIKSCTTSTRHKPLCSCVHQSSWSYFCIICILLNPWKIKTIKSLVFRSFKSPSAICPTNPFSVSSSKTLGYWGNSYVCHLTSSGFVKSIIWSITFVIALKVDLQHGVV